MIVLGPPGSGKSTLAARLAERLGAAHVDVGSLFRELGAEDSALGREVAAAIAAGRLLPDDLAERVVRERLEALPPEQGFVLDGFPRNAAQAEALRGLLGELGRLEPRPVAVRLDVPREELVRRLMRRRGLDDRPDDAGETIVRRLDLDDAHAPRLLDALAGSSDVVHVDGGQPVEAITDEVVEAVRRPS